MKVAIIGAGNVGKALATSITNAGHDVTIAAKNSGNARAAADEIGTSSADSSAAAVDRCGRRHPRGPVRSGRTGRRRHS